ncbi:hypothetical protein NL676_029699 [Syzygium grande]|nr:hypothetical protein NL676_029699 [Syzygium grande]
MNSSLSGAGKERRRARGRLTDRAAVSAGSEPKSGGGGRLRPSSTKMYEESGRPGRSSSVAGPVKPICFGETIHHTGRAGRPN